MAYADRKRGWPLYGAYKRLTRESIKRLKRLRKSDMFVVDAEFYPLECDLCLQPITKEGDNRATYFPKTKVLQVLHYQCSWQHLFGQIYSMDGREARIHEGHLEFVYINGKSIGLA